MPLVGPIRVTTIVAGVAIATAAILRSRSGQLALVAVVAWAALYEILSDGTGVIALGWPLGNFLWQAAALSGWLLLSIKSGLVPNRWLLLGFAILWLTWALAGFISNTPSGAHYDAKAEIFNEGTKTLLALAYLFGRFPMAHRPAIRA